MTQRLKMTMLLGLSICFVMFGTAQAARAATFVVDTTADDAALTACTPAANDCSLRGAISAANAAAGADTIDFDAAVFSAAQTIAFTWNSPRQHLVINSDLTINGPGATLLTVKGYPIGNGTYVSTLFEITGGVVVINNLKLTGGFGKTCYEPNRAFGCGGAISMSGGTVTVRGAAISGNIAERGGGISTSGGTLTVTDSTITANNSASTGSGGGIYVSGGSANIVNTTISGNLAGYGGGVNNSGGMLNINNSTVSGNTAQNRMEFVTLLCQTADQCQNPPLGFTCSGTQCTGYVSRDGIGGGILNNAGTINIKNSTISGNIAQGYATTGGTWGGGGIWNRAALTVANSTITGNYGQYGGGIGTARGSTSNLSNSIVAGNSRNTGAYGGDGADIFNYPTLGNNPGGTATGNYNLVQSGDTVTGTNNITGQAALLGPLANNGGPTQTHALLPGSPALDAGDPNFDATATPFDQRGTNYARKYGSAIDIGAFEYYPQTVNTLADHDDGGCSAGDCTLREAVKYAPDGAAVTFGVAGTIVLTQGEIVIDKNLTINGPVTAPGITISGNNSSRIFYVNTAGIGASTVNLSALNLTGGNGVGSGVSGVGGAVYVDTASTMTISNSTISGNTAAVNAGGIRGGNARLTITNSTISGNIASGTGSNGGGLRFGGIVKIANSTISGNTAGNGGGIYYTPANSSYTLTLTNSIVAGNTATSSPDIYGAVAGDYNLVQNTGGATLAGTHNITGQAALLGALADNGGATKTMALLAGSPALDAGDPNFDATATPFDQRGAGFARKVGGAIDIGAFEVQPALTAQPDLTIAKSHAGNFTQGETGKTYTITVANSGGAASSGTVSVTDTLPAGLTATAIGGTGWNCSLSSLTCTRSDALGAGTSYSAITLTVNVAANASASVTNTASVSGGGETNAANNAASDPTTIIAAVTYTLSGQITNGGEGLSGVTVVLSGSTTATAPTDAAGNYSFSNLSGGGFTLTPSLNGYTFVQPSITVNNLSGNQANLNFATSVASFEGDVAARPTGDGTVDILDIITVGNIIADLPGVAPLTAGGEFQRADVAPRASKGDGSVDVQDLIQMQLYAAALNPLTPASGATTPIVPPSPFAENPDGDETSSDILTSSPTAGTAAISASTAAATGGTATVPIQLNSTNVGGVQFTVTYDPAKLSIPSLAAITDRAPNVSFTFNNSTPGQLGVVAFQSTAGDAFPASALLFNIKFSVGGGSAPGATPIGFGNSPVPVRASDPAANAATVTTTPGAVTILAPTAASVSISGRAVTADGRGIGNALIQLTDSQGNVRSARTTSFGYYRFADVAAGATYVVAANSKKYEFSQPTQVLNVSEDVVEIDFTANPL